MHGLIRRIPLVALSATLLGGTLAPAMAQAAPLRAQPKTVQWAPGVIERTVAAGSFHRLGIATRFNTPEKLQRATFTIRFNGGLYAAPTSTGLGTVGRGAHDLAFTVSVPARTRTGSYLGTGRLFHLQGRRVVQTGANLYVIVRVVGAPAPRPQPRPRPRPIAPVIRWQPANSLGAIAVQRGQTVTETVSFTSNVALTNARVARELGDYASDHGVRVRVVSPLAPTSVLTGTAVPVVFTVSAGSAARLGAYPADLRVDAATANRRYARLGNDLDFLVAVRRDVAVVQWQPSDNLGPIAVQRGQTVTETASFTSSVALTNVDIRRALGEDASERGVRVAVVSPATLPSVAANTPISVTFTLAARAGTPVGSYPSYLYVVGTEPGGPRAILHYGLHFAVRVTAVAAAIHWQPANGLGTLTVQRGQTITETATFTSDLALSNAEIVHDLSGAGNHGVVVTVLTPVAPATIPVGAPVTVNFTISAAPGARIAGYPAALYVKASPFGGPAVALHYGLHFKIDVDQVPATTVSWNNGGNYVTFPAIARGQIVTETATFTTSADVANASLRLVHGQRLKGVRVTVAPLAGATIAANAPTTVNVIIDATAMPAKQPAGFVSGDIFLIAQPASTATPRLLHYGLHFTGAAQ